MRTQKGEQVELDMARDFTRYPAGRVAADGKYSGEVFRKNILLPRLREKKRIRIILDSALGYGSSFLDEAFGGLIRSEGMTYEEVKSAIELVTSDDSLRDEIEQYLKEAVDAALQ